MPLGRFLTLAPRRLRALTVLGVAVRDLFAGRYLRGATLVVVAFLSWKFLAFALAVDFVRHRLRGRSDAGS